MISPGGYGSVTLGVLPLVLLLNTCYKAMISLGGAGSVTLGVLPLVLLLNTCYIAMISLGGAGSVTLGVLPLVLLLNTCFLLGMVAKKNSQFERSSVLTILISCFFVEHLRL